MSTTASADDPVTLMDLDVEILAEVLSCLEARWRGAAVQTCKMFALLSSELALETTYLVSTVAQSVEEAQALGESVPAAPSVGVIFSNTRGQGGAQKGITKLVRSLPPAMHAIGGEVDTLVGTQSAGGADAASAPAPAAGAASSSANNGAAAQGPDDKEEEEEEEDEYSEMMMPAQWMVYQQQKRASKRLPRAAELMVRRETGIALTLGAFPEATVSSFVVHPRAQTSDPPALEQLEAQGAMGGDWKVMVLMMVGASRGIGDVIGRLQAAHPDAAIIGGVATGRWLVRAHAHKVEYVRNGVVGLMFGGNVPLTALVCSGAPASPLKDAAKELAEQRKALLGGLLFTCTARDEEDDEGEGEGEEMH